MIDLDTSPHGDSPSPGVVSFAGLDVVVHHAVGGRVLITLCGELDAAAVPVLADQLGTLADVDLDVDLRYTTFIDSSGVMALRAAALELDPDNEVVIHSPNPMAARIFALLDEPSSMRIDGSHTSAALGTAEDGI